MKQFFEEYGGVIMVLIVVAVLVGIVGTDGKTGISGKVNSALTKSVNTFTTQVSGITVSEPSE